MYPYHHTLAFLQSIGMPEMIVIGVVALLIFGRRLPEVGRSLGKGIVEFKKGLREVDDDIKVTSTDADTGRKQFAEKQPDEPAKQH
jgi:sec-independent protein translocase protein TatA